MSQSFRTQLYQEFTGRTELYTRWRFKVLKPLLHKMCLDVVTDLGDLGIPGQSSPKQ